MQAAAAAAGPTYTLLQYTYVADILEQRGPHREGHLEGARRLAAQGKIVLAGAVGNPPNGALFVFKDTSEQVPDVLLCVDLVFVTLVVACHETLLHALAIIVQICADAGAACWLQGTNSIRRQ
jgi:uncharacterized protein YciI